MEVGYHTFPSGKKYTYLKRDGRPIFLRNICFLSKIGDPHTIVVVREWGSKSDNQVWEPPKGQMEWKEFQEARIHKGQTLEPQILLHHMKEAVQREMTEEAKILPEHVKDLSPLPLVYTQDWPESGVPKAAFLYQFWLGHITDEALKAAQNDMKSLVGSPDLKEILLHDYTEKDAVAWWNPKHGWSKIRSGFSKKMTALYYDYLKRYGSEAY